MSELLAIGECMVEFARESDGRYGLRYGGDTLNTAIYARRAGAATGYATALGDDPYSDGIRALCVQERVDGTAMLRVAGRMPGLYVIETDAAGERSFHYWRDRAPARELFELPGHEQVVTAMRAAKMVYFSGITLSLYSARGRDIFHDALAEARRGGALIAFDGNYRPRGWGNNPVAARPVFTRFLGLTDIFLPTFDDEAMLWGDASPQDTIARLAGTGIAEIGVKLGPQGVILVADGAPQTVPVPDVLTPVDTTAAGDSFNGAYLAARLAGEAPHAAALAGHRMAGRVIMHRGAIIPAA